MDMARKKVSLLSLLVVVFAVLLGSLLYGNHIISSLEHLAYMTQSKSVQYNQPVKENKFLPVKVVYAESGGREVNSPDMVQMEIKKAVDGISNILIIQTFLILFLLSTSIYGLTHVVKGDQFKKQKGR